MTKFIDKDAVVAEIERIQTEECLLDTYEGRCKSLWFQRFHTFLNSLEVKDVDLEKEPASEDLDTAIERYIEQHKSELTGYFDIRRIAKHFAQWQKEQMMKDAVEGEVKTLYRHIVYVESVGFDSSSIRENKQDVFAGDKVKVIIIKE